MTYGVLSPEIAQEAVDILRPKIVEFLNSHGNRQHLSIVVTTVDAIVPKDPNRSFKENCLVVDGIGDRSAWEYDYESGALQKAASSVRTGLNAGHLSPHQLVPGDSIHPGSVCLEGIVVACSGIQGHFDEMISGWIAATIKGLCKEKFENARTIG